MRELRAGLIAILLLSALPSYTEPTSPSSESPSPHRSVHPPRRLSSAGHAKYAPDRVLVRFRAGTAKSDAARSHAGVQAQVLRAFSHVDKLHLVQLPPGASVAQAVHAYRQDPNVLYAEPDYFVHVDTEPNDPRFAELWNLRNTGQSGGTPGADIHAAQAWTLSTGSSEVVVGITDTGIDYTHQDLAANMFRNEADCNQNGVDDDGNGYIDDCYGIDTINNNSDPIDDYFHGTHVAGTIGATGNNGLGVVGVNWTVKLMACKFIGADGYGNTSGAIACLEYFATMKDRGINLVATNNSWGGDTFSQALFDAIDTHRQRGILFIAAAGNNGKNTVEFANFPSDYYLPNVIAVAATDANDNRAAFSNYGRRSVHLGAPGVSILSTVLNSGYGLASGTSMATPHVAGAVALLKAQNPTRDWKNIRNLLLAGGDPIPALTKTISQRRLNLYGAMTCSNSVVRTVLQPRTALATVSSEASVPLDVAMLHIRCGVPNGNVGVAVDGVADALVLHDDGTGGDREAGDGIYSAQYLPSTPGTHTLTFPDGETVTVHTLQPYRFSSTAFNYRNISGTALNIDWDDGSVLLNSPFPIPFGGGSFDQFYVNTNGNISFTAPFTNPAHEPMPTATGSALVAAWWDDLGRPSGANGLDADHDVVWGVIGVAPHRELVVEWRNITHVMPLCLGYCFGDMSQTVTFQVVFFEDSSNVLFNYADTMFDTVGKLAGFNHGAQASVGVQISREVATQFSFNSYTLNDGTAILWELGHQVPALTQLSPFSALTGSPPFELKLNGQNFVPGATVRWSGVDRAATFVSSSELRAAVTDADLASSAEVQVQIFNPALGGGVSNQMPFSIYAQYPVPVLTGRPIQFTAGWPGSTFSVYGSNFVNPSVVRWNGSDRPTTVLNNSLIMTSISASDIAYAGTAELTVFNPAPGGGTSNALAVAINNPAPNIYDIYPGWAPAGAPDKSVRVDSWPYAFNSATVVRWNGQDRPTTLINRGSVQVALTAQDIAAPGTGQITVYNPPPGGGTSQAVTLEILAPPPNDNRADAIEASPLPFTRTVDLRPATVELDDPVPPCGQYYWAWYSGDPGSPGPFNTVWFKYTPATDVALRARINGDYIMSIVSVWPGGCDSWYEAESISDAYVSFMAQAGFTYFIMISDDRSGHYGDILQFTLEEIINPPVLHHRRQRPAERNP